jgi:ketosteroid isomerase-like protein
MRKLFIAIIATTLLSSCGSKSPKTPGAPPFILEEISAHIDSLNKIYGDRFTTGDPALYTARYCADAIIMPSEMAQIKGRDSIRHFNYNDGKNKHFRVVITATKIYGGPDAVIEEGYYTFPGEDGKIYDKGKFIAIWKQEEGVWKLFREIWNTDNAPAK